MKTLSTPVSTQAAASQGGWAELYDIYLPSAITTPQGTMATLRLTPCPGGLGFFTPKLSPEPTGTQGDAATYSAWPMTREVVSGESKFASDSMTITASNVTAEWAGMIAAIEWRDVSIVIRKIPLDVSGLTADDCAVLWSGQVDAAVVRETQITFSCSNDFANLQATAPRENMHTSCRFKWADDACTALRFLAAHYKSKTCGASSTTTRVNSSGLTEDSSDGASYGTDLVNALDGAAITASSEAVYYSNEDVTAVPDHDYFDFTDHKFSINDEVQFTASVMPGGLTAGVTYYVIPLRPNRFRVKAAPGGEFIDITSAGTSVKLTAMLDPRARSVKSGATGYWKMGDAADWGTLSEGYYQIPDAQAGLANAALKPYIQFDFGSAKTPTVWRISTVTGVRLEELVRLLAWFSSANGSDWVHETYFEVPPRGGVLYDVLIPSAASARYWRICVRSRWAEALFYTLINKVYAYEAARHFWAWGRITFKSDTTTAALRGVSRRVVESYAGYVKCAALPVEPESGDTFVIERGCRRTFNDCAARRNVENFGGFTDLPYQNVVR